MPKNNNRTRHADLAKMHDNNLINELVYLETHAYQIGDNIKARIKKMLKDSYIGGLKLEPLQVPIWKLHEDHQSATDRMQAIIEELEYRQIP